jgi:hypothetical protein
MKNLARVHVKNVKLKKYDETLCIDKRRCSSLMKNIEFKDTKGSRKWAILWHHTDMLMDLLYNTFGDHGLELRGRLQSYVYGLKSKNINDSISVAVVVKLALMKYLGGK